MHDHGVLNRAELGRESPFGLLESKHHATTEHFKDSYASRSGGLLTLVSLCPPGCLP